MSTHAEHAKKLSGILLLKIPEGICAKSLTEDIQFRFSEDVVDINDLHIWDAMHGQIVATLAITYKDDVVRHKSAKRYLLKRTFSPKICFSGLLSG